MLQIASSRRAGMLAVCLILSLVASAAGAFVGVNLGADGSRFSNPQQLVDLLNVLGINQVRLHDAEPAVISAFAGSGIELLVGISNEKIHGLGASKSAASNWLKEIILPQIPSTKITGIMVGNEVFTRYVESSDMLLPAMRNLHSALSAAALDTQIKLSSPQGMQIMSDAFPPSKTSFNPIYLSKIIGLLDFLATTGSYFMLNVDPLAVTQHNMGMPLEYFLLQPNKGAYDSKAKLVYKNYFDTLVDATFNAMELLNHSDILITVSEMGWPTSADVDENAGVYTKNLIKHVSSNEGTPKRPGIAINSYIHEMLGTQSDQSWSLFHNLMAMNRHELIERDGTVNPPDGVSTASNGTTPTSGGGSTWCVAKAGVSDSVLAVALNWACGPGGADCAPTQSGGVCYLPNTYSSHASYAFNSYFQRSSQAAGTCDFGGAATTTNVDPSYSSCQYPSSASGSSSSSNSTGSPSSSSTIQPFNPNSTSDGLSNRMGRLATVTLLVVPIMLNLRA